MTDVVYNKNGVGFDIDAIATDINGKMDRDGLNSLASVCVESWHDENGNWYRVYSDGWCEQGGTAPSGSTSVTFLKPFINADYYFNANLTDGEIDTTLHIISGSYSTTGCSLMEGQYVIPPRALTATAKWRACGYIR